AIPLSGGADSRTVLAASIAAGVRPKTFTFHKSFKMHGREITAADAHLPRVLSRLYGVEHSYIRPQRRSEKADIAVLHHTAGRFDDVDRHYIANGQWDLAPTRCVVLRGGLFEAGKRRNLENWLVPGYEQGTVD